MPPRRVSAQYQAFLDQDRPGSGKLINFRRVPGYGPGNKNYYDPITGAVRSEYYVLNVYRPRLEEGARITAERTSRSVAKRQRDIRASLADTYTLRQAANRQPVDQREFTDLYIRLKEVQLEVRFYPIEDVDARTDLLSPGSEYHNLLVALGRRLGNEDWPIGDSPENYINNVVIPTLIAIANGEQAPDLNSLIEAGDRIIEENVTAAQRRAQRLAEREEMRRFRE